jgi:hypothetical protein
MSWEDWSIHLIHRICRTQTSADLKKWSRTQFANPLRMNKSPSISSLRFWTNFLALNCVTSFVTGGSSSNESFVATARRQRQEYWDIIFPAPDLWVLLNTILYWICYFRCQRIIKCQFLAMYIMILSYILALSDVLRGFFKLMTMHLPVATWDNSDGLWHNSRPLEKRSKHWEETETFRK